MAKKLSVSDGTVRNRIEKMEARDLIEGYVPTLNYEEAGFPLRVVFNCTAPIEQRDEMAEQALQVPNTVNVREMLTSRSNINVFTVATETDDITRAGAQLVELGLDVESEQLVRKEYVQPFDHFGEQAVENQNEDG